MGSSALVAAGYFQPLLAAGSVVQIRIPLRCLRVFGGVGGVEMREESLEMQPRVVVGMDELVAELVFIACAADPDADVPQFVVRSQRVRSVLGVGSGIVQHGRVGDPVGVADLPASDGCKKVGQHCSAASR